MNDREKLISLLGDDTCNCDCEKCEHEENSDACIHHLKESMADHLIANSVTMQEARRWIPVTERLPVSEGTYLVYTERGSVYASHFYTEKRFASGYVRESQWSQRGKVKVTHWMPLPEPPKEDA